MVESQQISNLTIEEQYIRDVSDHHRKSFAQFFTPTDIAQFMISWILGVKPTSVLEPAFGLGIFSRQILNNKDYKQLLIKGFEIDHKMYSWAKELFSQYSNVELYNEDYMYNDWDNKYDGIVCNPPYLKFHDYGNIDIVNEVENQSGIRFKKTSNLYSMFLVKSIMQMAAGGRASYIVPTEFLNSDYGIVVKKFLLESNVLRYIFVIDFNYMAFANTLTTSTIFLLQNDASTDTVGMKSIASTEELKRYQSAIDTNTHTADMICLKQNDIDYRVKWTAYYRQREAKRINKLVPFSHYARVKRGIATGDNDYFTFNKTKAAEFSIPGVCLIPCIVKAQDVASRVFTESDFKQLLQHDKKVYLLDAMQDVGSKVESYLDLGLSLGVHTKYLTSKRNPWFSLEQRPPSDLWIGVFNRSKPRIILNDAHVRNLTAFHSIYINRTSEDERLLFIAYLLSEVSIYMLESCRREYGNGLNKLEPNDINNSLMLDISCLSDSTKQQITDLLSEYLTTIRNSGQGDYLLEQINYLFSEAFNIKE